MLCHDNTIIARTPLLLFLPATQNDWVSTIDPFYFCPFGLRPRFSKNNHFPQKQTAVKVYHCYAILAPFGEFCLEKTKSVVLVHFGKVGENLEN
jgi:hypothetical protein